MLFESEDNTPVVRSDRPLRHRGVITAILKRLLAGLPAGRLTVVTPAGEYIHYQAAAQGPEAVLVFHTWRALGHIILGGDVGFAEAYIAGEWSSPDLTALLAMAASNCDYFERAILGCVPLRIFNRLRHLLNANSKSGSRRNIGFHYDLGNDFYRLWLDRSMTYSSALYEAPGQSLEDAQQAKQRYILDLLALDGGERVLEIGCGWGSLAAQLTRLEARVTALTLSQQQLTHAQAVIGMHGRTGQAELRLQDYRDVDGRFDRIVSIEMLEAVGEQYWPVYFKTLRERLRPGGKAVLQVITIREERFAQYRKGVDFIQRYVFPGGLLPTMEIIRQQTECAGLRLASVKLFGESYALTLAEWRRRLLAAWPEIEQLGFQAPFRRLWEYYLSYCEAGFRAKDLDVGLYLISG
ncbi:MAG TPA: cyclopropane-fatty-acyl-phospholipid synthase family protein [Stellaceae bacterium]|jgi:cyclopropane-fatty-acyl-phospholipid synthase|nr:cyclopropane-fatty-acyl-phospholipid synthase family protein [Stellaceae bacterium]